MAFSEAVEIDLGDVTCQLVHVGGDHGADCSVVYVPEDKAIFLGDCLGPDLYHGAPHYTTEQVFPLLDRLLRFDADMLPGEPRSGARISRETMVQDADLFHIVGQTVERVRGDRGAAIAALHEQRPVLPWTTRRSS